MPRIEILHQRDPDCACDITVWVDGERVDIDLVDIDPGRGYERADWDESRQFEQTVAGRSPAFKAAIAQAYDLGGESQYITD